jgi:hypothetical protein
MKKRARITWATLTIGFVSIAAVSQIGGCLEMPILHVKPSSDAGDAESPSDAHAPTSDGPGACEACLRAPSQPGYGCGDQMAACSADPVCSATIECAIAKGCFALNGQPAIIDCGTPCGREAGLDITSPAIELIFAMIACGQDVCGSICRGEDAGPVYDR